MLPLPRDPLCLRALFLPQIPCGNPPGPSCAPPNLPATPRVSPLHFPAPPFPDPLFQLPLFLTPFPNPFSRPPFQSPFSSPPSLSPCPPHSMSPKSSHVPSSHVPQIPSFSPPHVPKSHLSHPMSPKSPHVPWLGVTLVPTSPQIPHVPWLGVTCVHTSPQTPLMSPIWGSPMSPCLPHPPSPPPAGVPYVPTPCPPVPHLPSALVPLHPLHVPLTGVSPFCSHPVSPQISPISPHPMFPRSPIFPHPRPQISHLSSPHVPALTPVPEISPLSSSPVPHLPSPRVPSHSLVLPPQRLPLCPPFPSLCPLTPLPPFPLSVPISPHCSSSRGVPISPHHVSQCLWVSLGVCVSLSACLCVRVSPSVRRLTRSRSHAPQEGGGAALGRCGPGPSGRRAAAAGPSGRRAAAAPAQRRQQRRQQRGGGAPGAAAAGRQPRGPQARQARRGGGGSGGGGARRPRGPRAEHGDLRARAQQGAHQARGLQEPGAAPDLRCHQLGPDRPQGGAQAAGGVPEPGPEPVGASPLREPGGAARALGGVGALRRPQPADHGRGQALELGAEREGAAGPRGHEARGGAAADRGPGQRGHRGGRLRQEPHPGTDRERLRVRLRGEQAGPAGAGEPDGRRAQPHPDPVQWAANLQAGLRGRVQHGHGLQGQPVFLRVPRVRPAGAQFRREVHRAGAAHRVRLRAAAAARGALRGAHQGRAGAARAQRRGQGRGLRGQPHAGAGLPEARVLLGLWWLRAPGPRGAEGRDGSQAGEALRLPGARRRPDLRGIHLLLRRQRDRWVVLLGRHQHLPGVHHVPQGRAGPVRVEDPQPGLREELRHRGSRREHHQLGALAHLRGAGIWGPQTQIVHGGAGGENPGWDLHRAGGHGLFPLSGDRPGRVGGGAGEAAEAAGVQPPHPLRGPDPDPDPASPSRPPCSLPAPALPALGGVTPTPIPGFWNSPPRPGLPACPALGFVGSGLELFFILFVFFRSFFLLFPVFPAPNLRGCWLGIILGI